MCSTRSFSILYIFVILHQLSLIDLSHESKEDHGKCSCGQVVEDEIEDRVMGGAVLRKKAHPFLAMVTYKNIFICGGSIVGPYYILTAGHCLHDVYNWKILRVMVGVHDAVIADSWVKTHTVNKAIIHNDFKILKGGIIINDIALVKVNRIEFNDYVKPICLPFKIDVSQFKAAAVAGWGNVAYKGNPSRMPRVTLQSVLTNSQCKMADFDFSNVPTIYSVAMCAYKNAADACQGDSGGPLYVRNEKDITFQIGIVSFGYRCGSFGKPAIYTRLTNYLEWLQEHLEDGSCINNN